MSDVKIVLNSAGVRELLRSEEIQAACTQEAMKIKQRLGKGYAVSSHRGKNRVNASIYTKDPRAKADNLKNNTVLKALGGRR